MEQLLSKLHHKYSIDIDFSFSLIKSTNFYYLFIDNKICTFKEHPLNTQFTPQPPRNLNLKTELTGTLLEGFWDGKIFYITDLLAQQNEICKEPYSQKQNQLRNICDNNNIFSPVKIYLGIKLEVLLSEIIPNTGFKPKYILMKKDMQNYIIPVISEKETEQQVVKKTRQILQSIDCPAQSVLTMDVMATDISEIYVGKLSEGVYTVIRIPDIKTGVFLRTCFKVENIVKLTCKYNPIFKKYEYKSTGPS